MEILTCCRLRYIVESIRWMRKTVCTNVSNGDAQAAWLEIQKLLEDNQVNCLAPEAMQFLVSNIAVSIIRVVGRISKETALPVSQQVVMEACRQGEAEKMREELKHGGNSLPRGDRIP